MEEEREKEKRREGKVRLLLASTSPRQLSRGSNVGVNMDIATDSTLVRGTLVCKQSTSSHHTPHTTTTTTRYVHGVCGGGRSS